MDFLSILRRKSTFVSEEKGDQTPQHSLTPVAPPPAVSHDNFLNIAKARPWSVERKTSILFGENGDHMTQRSLTEVTIYSKYLGTDFPPVFRAP